MSEKEKIILGLDLSIASTGVAVLNGDNGNIIAYDNLPTKHLKGDRERIHYIAGKIIEIAKAYNVTHVAVEDSYVGTNSKVAIKLARLFGAVTTMLYDNGFTLIYEYTPAKWRKISMGVGNKSKEGTYNWLVSHLITKEEFGEFCEKGVNKNDDIVDSIVLAYALYKKLNNE